MPAERVLDDPVLLEQVVMGDVDAQMCAIWVHLLKDALAAGEVSFPITSQDELEPVLERARQTLFPPAGTDADGNVASLPLPRPGTLDDISFPIDDILRFIVEVWKILKGIRHQKWPPV